MAGLGLFLGFYISEANHNDKPKQSFADKINHACPKGTYMSDFSASDEWGNPAHVVFVNCFSNKEDEYGTPLKTVKIAVSPYDK